MKGINEIQKILQVLIDSMKISYHKSYEETVNSQNSQDLVPVKIVNFSVTEIKSLFCLINSFFNII